jgi:hypothetical protein
VIGLLVGILGSLIAAALFPGLQAAAVGAMVRAFGWLPFRQPALLQGTWSVVWGVDSPRYEREQPDPAVQVKQLGRRVYATVKAKQATLISSGS